MTATLTEPVARPVSGAALRRPRLGFLGVGWIGLSRLEALAKADVAEIAAIADPSREMAARAGAIAPKAVLRRSLDDLLDDDLDGVVIATPSAQHAEQAAAALQKGVAVFCQKPLGRDSQETRAVVELAQRQDRLLGVDLSYRFMAGVRRMRELIRSGELGRIYAAEMLFHNAYGPDKPWFYDRKLSGGGCVIDLGIHLVDLALWLLEFPQVRKVESHLFAGGQPWRNRPDSVEDYVSATLELETGTIIQIGCSWKLPAGKEAVIQGQFYGTEGGTGFRNVNGSFYEFVAERYQGTKTEPISSGPEEWGGRAAVEWAKSLARSARFDPETAHVVEVAEALDLIYGRPLSPRP